MGTMNNSKISVALFAGGCSDEREVSLSTSHNIYRALLELNFNVKVFDPALGKNQFENHEDVLNNTKLNNNDPSKYIELLNSNLLDGINLVFLGLHGKYGEDGAIQSLLDLKGIKYTGSGAMASAIGMDKNMSKIIFRHFDIQTADWFVIEGDKFDLKEIQNKIENTIGYPCIIKPNDGGSTIGLTLCEMPDQVEEAIRKSAEHSRVTMVEKFIDGRELTVAIIEDEVMPVLEIIPKHKLYDYECKYSDGMSEYIVPANLDKNVSQKLQKKALEAYKAVDCGNYGRVDFRLTKDLEEYCFEVNTLPGLTAHSLLPKMAKAAGIDFNSLISKIISGVLG